MIMCILERPELDQFEAGHGDLEGVIDQLRLTKGIEVALLASASDTETSKYKFSMRSIISWMLQRLQANLAAAATYVRLDFSAVGDINEIYHTAEALIKEQLDPCTME